MARQPQPKYENVAHQPRPQYEFRYQRVELFKTKTLGIGSYGAVCKAMCDDLPCAAKILHPALFQFTAPGTTNIMQKFEQECRLLSAIKHPHIVQYLGMYRDPESRLPVLLMELMDESLTRFLERLQEPLPYHTEVNLCHDIAMALSYLHSNGIVHRDLSSNNVLLIAGSRAKVTDFGMVKLYDVNRSTVHLTPLTQCPGTTVYMPPEALGEPPMYTDKLDSFSLGVLCVQIMTQQFPDPGDRFQIMEIKDPRIPSGKVKMDIPEIERRQLHIDMIDPAHPLLPVALECLKDRDRERPSCHDICGKISTLKASSKYNESIQQSRSVISEREVQIQDLQQQLHTKDYQLQQREAVIAAHQQEIQQLRQQLQSSEQVIAEFQQNLLERENTIQGQQRQIQELLRQQRPRQTEDQQQKEEEEEASDGTVTEDSVMLMSCRDGEKAPYKMWGEVAAVDGSMAYFSGDPRSKKVYAHDSSSKTWSELPICPNYGFSLAIVNTHLTAIGGKMPNREVTSSLLSLTDNNWKEQFPPMPTKRCATAAVCSGRSLVVAGGTGEGDWDLSAVEVMDTETLQWSTASSLPHPLYQGSATLCGDQVYMLGGRDLSGKRSKSVFTSSLATLLESCQPQSLEAQLKASGPEVWHQLADTPFTSSTCASMHGRMLIVGGRDSGDKERTTIHVYKTKTNSWEVIGYMMTPRCRCPVAILSDNELIIVGGLTPNWKTDSVEIVTLT